MPELSQNLLLQENWLRWPEENIFYQDDSQTLNRSQVWEKAFKLSATFDKNHRYIWVLCQNNIVDWINILAAWINNQTPILLHSYLTQEQILHYKSLAIPAGDLGILTSGSTGQGKLVMHLLPELMAAASSVNFFFNLKPDDQWNWQLPISHIGGLSIFMRAMIGGFTVVNGPLKPNQIVSWVPTQLQKQLEISPIPLLQNLKLILLGGAPISIGAWNQACDNKLPLSLSYGLSESAAAIAATLNSDCYPGNPLPGAHALPGRKIRINKEGLIEFSLLTQPDVFMTTQDRGILDKENSLHVLGRNDRIIISGGINIPLEMLEDSLSLFGLSQAIGINDQKWGEAPVVFLWPKGIAPTAVMIENHLGHKLPKQFWPKAIYNAGNCPINGKLSKDQLIQWMPQAPILFKRH